MHTRAAARGRAQPVGRYVPHLAQRALWLLNGACASDCGCAWSGHTHNPHTSTHTPHTQQPTHAHIHTLIHTRPHRIASRLCVCSSVCGALSSWRVILQDDTRVYIPLTGLLQGLQGLQGCGGGKVRGPAVRNIFFSIFEFQKKKSPGSPGTFPLHNPANPASPARRHTGLGPSHCSHRAPPTQARTSPSPSQRPKSASKAARSRLRPAPPGAQTRICTRSCQRSAYGRTRTASRNLGQ